MYSFYYGCFILMTCTTFTIKQIREFFHGSYTIYRSFIIDDDIYIIKQIICKEDDLT